jgi:hypothetical protein
LVIDFDRPRCIRTTVHRRWQCFGQ